MIESSSPLRTLIDALEAHGCKPKRSGNGWQALCPAHDDHHPSLSITEGEKQPVALHCHGGCTPEMVLSALGLKMTDICSSELPPERREVAAYDYTDEDGKLLFQCVRFEPKDFRQRRPDGNGGWVWNLNNVRRVLYRLPAVLATVESGGTIYIVEGEKDADRINDLEDLKGCATCNPMGAGKWRPEYADTLKGAESILIIADKDEAGRRHALDVRGSLEGEVGSFEIVQAAEGNDVSDHLAAGLSLDQLEPMQLEAIPARWIASTLEGVAKPSAGEVAHLIEKLIPRGEVIILGATWKAGKTLIIYCLILQACSGQAVLGYFPIIEPIKVALFQLEMPSSEDDRRFRRLAIGCGIDPEAIPTMVKSGQLTVYNRPHMNLREPADITRFQQAVIDSASDLVVIDSVLAAFAGADLNDNSEVRHLFAQAFHALTSRGVSVILLHHKRKTAQGGKKDDDRAALLGAQAWGAAAGRIYSLDRIAEPADDPRGEPEHEHGFHARLSLTGSWTPEAETDFVIQVHDEGDGTLVKVLGEDQQLQAGGITKQQKAALALCGIVRQERRIARKDALDTLEHQHGISTATGKRGLSMALSKQWISTCKSEDGRHNEQDLIPGKHLGEIDE